MSLSRLRRDTWGAACLILIAGAACWSFGARGWAEDRPLVDRVVDEQGNEREIPIPRPLTRYKGREIAQTMHYRGAEWLTRESRQREEDCERMLKALDVKEGDVICDLGCGNGFYTLQLAKMVGEKGVVWGVDVQREMLQFCRERAQQADVKNIKLVHGALIDPFLPAESMDLVLLVDVYHEFSHPEHMLKAIRAALKPEGRLVLVEFRAEDPKVPILPLHKMSKKQVLKELEPNGFKLVREYDELPWQHMMFFGRDPDFAEPEKKSDDAKSDAPTGDAKSER